MWPEGRLTTKAMCLFNVQVLPAAQAFRRDSAGLSLVAKPFTLNSLRLSTQKACRGSISISKGNACLQNLAMQKGMHTELLCATGGNVQHHHNVPG